MRKEPQRRYSSVAQFSDDIRRYLERRPVVAHRDSVVYRAGKFVQRNRVAVAAAIVLFATLVGGIFATSWEAKRATEQARVAARERDRAQKRFNDVRQLSNALLFDVAPKIERIEGSTDARRALVTRALEYLDSLAQEAGSDPQLQGELAAAYEKVGELQGSPRKPNLNDFSGAVRSYEKARAIRNELFQRAGDSEQLRKIAADLSTLGALHWSRSDIKSSFESSKAALDTYTQLLAAPGSRDLRLAHAQAQIDLAATHYYNEELAKAFPLLREALASLEQLRSADAANTEILRSLARAHTLLGISLSWDSKQAEGEAEMAKAIGLGEALVAQNPHDNMFRQGLVDTKFQAAQLYEEVDNPRAFDFARQARDLAEEILRADPADIQAQQNVAKSYSMLGQIAVQLNKPEEATDYLMKSASLFAELVTRDPTQRTYKHDQGRVLKTLGSARQMRNEFGPAIDAYDKAIAVFGELQRIDPGNNFHVRKIEQLHSYKGDAYLALAQTNDASQREQNLAASKENYRRALDILLQLQAQQTFSDYDRKELRKVQAALAAP
jgi:tetratricopeptide (TPR) repeat protein